MLRTLSKFAQHFHTLELAIRIAIKRLGLPASSPARLVGLQSAEPDMSCHLESVTFILDAPRLNLEHSRWDFIHLRGAWLSRWAPGR